MQRIPRKKGLDCLGFIRPDLGVSMGYDDSKLNFSCDLGSTSTARAQARFGFSGAHQDSTDSDFRKEKRRVQCR
jgi:hypothetical protein